MMYFLIIYGIHAALLALPVVLAVRRCYLGSAGVCLLFAVGALSVMESFAFGLFVVALPLLLILSWTHAKPGVVCSVMGVWAISVLGLVVGSAVWEHRDLHATYPIESLAERLAYEIPVGSANTFEVAMSELAKRDGDARSVEDEDEARKLRRRQRVLAELHSQTLAEFVAANGFGASRMKGLRRWELARAVFPPAEPLPEGRSTDDSTATEHSDSFNSASNTDANHSVELLNHGDVIGQFTASTRGAYIPAWQQASGFLPHEMHRSPLLPSDSVVDWQLTRLELVSLLKFAKPCVYESNRLPRMEELRNTTTRPLDDFEQRGLQQLRDGRETAVIPQVNIIRMLGALRATKQCLACHSARTGELLGAFSYRLDRINNTAKNP
jgi:uncharacterized protein DUF3365